MIKSIPLPSMLVLLLLGLTGCSRPAPAPVVSIPNEKPSIQTPTEPPQEFKDLWAKANPLPEWTNPVQSGTNKQPVQQTATDGKGSDLEKILQKLEQIERRLDGLAKTDRFQQLTAGEIRDEVEQLFDGLIVAHLYKIDHQAEREAEKELRRCYGSGFDH
jgi:hypothetical protein